MNAHELAQRLADSAPAVAEYLLPKGKKAAGEWKAGSVSGEEGQSLSIRIAGHKKGLWRDFAKGEGGDGTGGGGTDPALPAVLPPTQATPGQRWRSSSSSACACGA